LASEQRAALDALLTHMTRNRTARLAVPRAAARDHEMHGTERPARLLKQWCTNVLRSTAEPMKEVATMIRKHFECILAWVKIRKPNRLLEAINNQFQAARREARRYDASARSAPSCCLSPARSTSPSSTRMSHNPLRIQQSQNEYLSRWKHSRHAQMHRDSVGGWKATPRAPRG